MSTDHTDRTDTPIHGRLRFKFDRPEVGQRPLPKSAELARPCGLCGPWTILTAPATEPVLAQVPPGQGQRCRSSPDFHVHRPHRPHRHADPRAPAFQTNQRSVTEPPQHLRRRTSVWSEWSVDQSDGASRRTGHRRSHHPPPETI